jgi:hypothetical protein
MSSRLHNPNYDLLHLCYPKSLHLSISPSLHLSISPPPFSAYRLRPFSPSLSLAPSPISSSLIPIFPSLLPTTIHLSPKDQPPYFADPAASTQQGEPLYCSRPQRRCDGVCRAQSPYRDELRRTYEDVEGRPEGEETAPAVPRASTTVLICVQSCVLTCIPE